MNKRIELTEIGLEITQNCNLDCIHCYLGKKDSSMLSVNFIKSILEKFGQEFNTIYLTGGEPFSHKNFIEIYHLIKKMGFFTILFTNASLLTDEIYTALKNNIPQKIKISIYGMSEQSYYHITHRKDMFQQIMNNINMLRELTKNISLNYILLRDNAHELDEFVLFCKNNNIHFSIYPWIMPKLKNKCDMSYALKSNELNDLFFQKQINTKKIYSECDFCDAGKNIFIDSKGFLRGCPVLRTSFDSLIEAHSIDTFNDVRNEIISYCKNKQYCPAWTDVEEKDQYIE